MNPIHMVLAHRSDWHRGPARIDGFFQYPVPEFVWEHLELRKRFHINLFDYRQHDLLWLDDGKYKENSEVIPSPPHFTYLAPQVVMYALYPTLSVGHLARRIKRARAWADLVLVDHDIIERWRDKTDLPCERMSYCTNEKRYRPLEKTIDVGFYCVYAWNKERPALNAWLEDFCARKGYSYRTTYGENIGAEYAKLLGHTKVVIHLNRTPGTRPPRIFDVSAAGACLLSNPMPSVEGEDWEGHYRWFKNPHSEKYEQYTEIPKYTDRKCKEIATQLSDLVEGDWKGIAENAREYVLKNHTWSVRAGQLRQVLLAKFPYYKERRRS